MYEKTTNEPEKQEPNEDSPEVLVDDTIDFVEDEKPVEDEKSLESGDFVVHFFDQLKRTRRNFKLAFLALTLIVGIVIGGSYSAFKEYGERLDAIEEKIDTQKLKASTPQKMTQDIIQQDPISVIVDQTSFTLVANSETQFSGEQGKYGWEYGFFPNTTGEIFKFQKFTNGAWLSNATNSSGFITETSMLPVRTGTNVIVGPVVRRLKSKWNGLAFVKISAELTHQDSSDGITIVVRVNGNDIWKSQLSVKERHKIESKIKPFPIKEGQNIDFCIYPNQHPYADDTSFKAKVYVGQK